MNRNDDRKQRVKRQFGATAEAYVASSTHAAGADLQRMIEVAAPNGRELAVDVATGGGHVVRAFAPLVRRVVGTDFTSPMISAARAFVRSVHLENVSWVLADAESLPFTDDSIDIVTCRIAPHHFPRPDRFVTEAARVLKRDGRFVLIDSTVPDGAIGDFFNRFEALRDPSHVRSLTSSQWLELIAATGLTVETAEPFPKRHDFDDWTARAKVPPAAYDELTRMMLDAAEEIRRAFGIETHGRRLVGFTDVKTLFLGRKS